jgi:hypothetical protein
MPHWTSPPCSRSSERIVHLLQTLILTAAASAVLIVPLHAQAPPPPAPGEPRVTPEDLRAPTSPAFALLGTTPASIGRPQTPRALTMNLISAVRDEGGLPRNYALEVAPYWTAYHPDLSFDDYYNAGLLQTLAQTFAVSVATTPMELDAVAGGTRLGAGFSALFRAGGAHPQLAAVHSELIAIDVRIAEASDAIPPLRQRAFDARRAGRLAEADELDKAVLAAEATADEKTVELRRQAMDAARRVSDLDRNRIGFQLAVAGGHVWDFPGDQFAAREAAQWGVWVTPAYRMLACRGNEEDRCSSTIDVMGAVRFLGDRRAVGDDHTWDVGGRLLWQPSLEFSVSVESLRRGGTTLTGDEGSSRTVGMIEYRLNDDIMLYGSFGKDFEGLPGARTLVSIIGVNLGFGRKPIVDVGR